MSTPTLVYFQQVLAEVDSDIARLQKVLLSKQKWRDQVRFEITRRRQRAQQRLETRKHLEIEADSEQAALAIADNAPLPAESDSTSEEVLGVELGEEALA